MRKKIAIIRLISLFSGVYFWLFAGITAYANPQSPQVVHGQAGFSNPNPNTLHVTNSPNAIINWQGFSIQSHEVTRFIQQSANSAVLNRVTGPNPSNLLGQLLSNGKVFLINPHGMVFGPDCVIDTAGFVASTLNITDQDFLQGNLKFEGGPDTGSIVNQGFITAGKNGDIYLIAPNIENSGIIHTQGGNLLLAAGESITVTSLDLKDVHFEIQAPENEVLNIGKVLADGGAVNVFAGTLKHSGEIRADTVSVNETGAIILSAGNDITLETGSTITANGPQGGTISVESRNGTTLLEGTVQATGGESKGGEIHLLGERVGVIDKALIDASGESGGGEILIGGDYQGKNPDIRNASGTYVGPDVTITADAGKVGDGGKVIVWADEVTGFCGSISARGGLIGGEGGFVEVSGKEHLIYRGRTDTVAPEGLTGTLLLDPDTIIIQGGTSDGDDTDALDNVLTGGTVNFADLPSTFTIYESEIEGTTSNILLQANDGITTSGTFGGTDILLGTDYNLTLETGNSSVNGIDLTGSADGANLRFRTQGTGTISLTTGNASTAPITIGRLATAGGDVDIDAGGGITFGNSTGTNIDAGAGDVTLTSVTGQILGNPNGSPLDVTTTGILTFKAETGIGAPSGAAFYVDVGSGVEFINNGSGDVRINNTYGGLIAGTNPGGGVILESDATSAVFQVATVGATTGITAGGDVVFRADELDIAQSVNAGTNTVYIMTNLPVQPVSVGGSQTLNLTDTELNEINAGRVIVGKDTFANETPNLYVATNADVDITGLGAPLELWGESITAGAALAPTSFDASNDVVFVGDDMSFLSNVSINSSGTVVLRPMDTGLDIFIEDIAGGGHLSLLPTELQTISANTVEIGFTGGTGTASIDSSLDSSDINAATFKIVENQIDMNGAINFSVGNENLELEASGAVNIGADLNTGTGTIVAIGGSGIVNFTGSPTINATSFDAGTLNISTGTVTLNTTSSAASLNLSGGTLSGTDTLTTTGVSSWTGGTISTDLDNSGTMTISGSTPTLDGGATVFNNTGTVRLTNVGLDFANGAIFNNQSGGLFEIQDNLNLGGSGGTFNNYDTIRKTGGASVSDWHIPVNMTDGTVDVQSGSFRWYNGGTYGGTLTVQNGQLGLYNGTHTLSAGLTIDGDGTGELAVTGGGTTNMGGAVDIDPNGILRVFGGTMNLSQALTVDGNFYVQSGTLNGSGGNWNTGGGTVTWNGGTITGTIDNTRTVLISGTVPALDGAATVFNNTGTVRLTNVGLNFDNGAVFNNQSGGLFEIQDNLNLGGSGGTFNNYDTIRKTGGVSVSDWHIPVNMTDGTVDVQSGSFRWYNGGSYGGTLTVQNGQLGLYNGTHTLSAGLTIDGDGIGELAVTGGGTTNMGGAVDIDTNGILRVFGGTMNLSQPLTVDGNFYAQSGTLNGSGGNWNTGGGTVTWNGGTITGTIANTRTVLISGAVPTLDGAATVFNNTGTVRLTNVGLDFDNGAVFNNQAGGLFEIQDNLNLGGTGGTFNNYDTIRKSGGASVSDWHIPVNMTDGTVDVQSGSFRWYNGGTYGGTLMVQNGQLGLYNGTHTLLDLLTIDGDGTGELAVTGGTTNMGGAVDIDTNGILRVAGGTMNLAANTLNIDGTMNVDSSTLSGTGPLTVRSGGTLDLNVALNIPTNIEVNDGTMDVAAATLLNGSLTLDGAAGLIQGNGGILLNGDFFFNRGTIDTGSGAFETYGNTSIGSTGNAVLNSRTWNNHGTVEWVGNNFSLNGTAAFNNVAGEIFRIQTAGTLGGTGLINNWGDFEKLSGGATTIDVTFNNFGTGNVKVNDGTLEVQTAFTNNGIIDVADLTTFQVTGANFTNAASGTIQGSGTITPPGSGLENQGTIIPGTSPGILTIDGDLELTSTSILDFEIGGTTPGTQHDQIVVTGVLSTPDNFGTLTLTEIMGYTGGSGDSFTIISCASGGNSGTFSTINQPASFEVTDTYNPTSIVLDASNPINVWKEGADGFWDVAGNWTLGVPLNTQDVKIDLDNWIITIPLETSAVAGTLLVGSGNTLSLLADSTLDVATSATIDGDLTITGGIFQLTAGNAAVSGDLTITGGEFRVPGGDAVINGLLTLQGGPGTGEFAELTANNITINGPALQVTGGAGNGSYASVRSTVGDLTIDVTNGITVQGGTAPGSDAYLQAQTGQDIDAAFVEVFGVVGDAFIDTNAGLQSIDTTGQNPSNFGILVEATGTGLAAIHSDGTQSINVSNADCVKVVGTVGNADISSNGAQTITVNDADSVEVVGTVGAAWISSANGSQTITLQGGGQNRLEVGAVGALNYSHIRSDGGDQAIHAGTGGDTQGKIVLQGGDHMNAEAQIFTTTDTVGQNITAKEAIDLHGKTAGAAAAHLAGAYIGSKGGFQTITVGGGTTVTGITINGGEASGTDEFNHAYSDIFLDRGAQTITVNDGGNITLNGGSAGSFNSARIHINTLGFPGTQTIEINGGDLIITGGSGDNDNSAGIWAGMPGLQHITADNITVTGGTSNNSEAYIVYNTPGEGQQLDVNGTLAITGGSGALTQEAEGFVFAEINQTISADSITVSGGPSGVYNRAGINAGDSQDITAGSGGILVQAGNSTIDQAGSGNSAGIFLNPGATGSQTIVVNGGGDITVLAGNGVADDWAAINSEGIGNTVTLNGGGDLVISGGSSDEVDFHADAEIYTPNDLTVNVSGNIDMDGGTGNKSQALLFSVDDLQVTVNGNVDLTGGANFNAEASIESDNDVQVTVTGGNVNMQGGSANETWAGFSADGSLVLNVMAGNLSVTGGNAFEASAGVSTDGGGTIDVNIVGDLTLTGGSGPDASAGIVSEGAGTPIININVGGDLVMSGGAGQGPAVIGSRDQSVVINIGNAAPIGGDISISGGTGSDALALIGAFGAGHHAAVTIEANNSLTLDKQTGGVLVGSELAGGVVDIKAGMDGTGGMVLNDGLIRTNDNISLAATGGNVTQGAAGVIYNGAGTVNQLNVFANTGISLSGANEVGRFASVTNSGGVLFNQVGNLIVNGLSAGGHDATLSATGSITQMNPINNTALLTVTAGGGITLDNAGNTISGFSATETSGSGVIFSQTGNLVVNGLNAGGGDATLSATGSVTQTAVISNTDHLTVTSGNGITLTEPTNSVSHFNATDTGGAGISYHNNGNLGLGLVNAGAGDFSVTVSSDILDDNGGSMNVIADQAQFSATTGSVGSLSDPIETQINTLVVTDADVEVGINNSGPLSISLATFPAAVTADILLMASTIDFSGSLSKPGSLDLRGANGITVNWDLTSTGGDLNLAAGSGALLIDGVTVTANQNMTLSGSSVRIEGNGNNDALATAGVDQTVNAGSLLVKGSDTGTGDAKLEASGTQTINASSVTVQGGDNADATASIDPMNLVMNVSGDVNVIGGDGNGSYAEISAETVGITAGPTLNAGDINITGGSGDNAGAWIKSTGGDVTLIAGDTMFPADINLIGGIGVNADAVVNANGGLSDVYLTFHNGVGLTLLPALTGATDVGILAMCLCLNSYNLFYQPPVDPINDVVSSQDQLDELLDEIMDLPDDLVVKGDGTGDDEEEEKKKRGRLICR